MLYIFWEFTITAHAIIIWHVTKYVSILGTDFEYLVGSGIQVSTVVTYIVLYLWTLRLKNNFNL